MEPARRRSESDYHFGRVLGEGSFSTVYVARELESRKEYASKSENLGHVRWRHVVETYLTHTAHYEWKKMCGMCVRQNVGHKSIFSHVFEHFMCSSFIFVDLI